MNIIGDIGNSEVKICLTDKNFKIKKKVNFKTNKINKSSIQNNLKFFLKYKNDIDKIIFSSVVPNNFTKLSYYFNHCFKN